MNPNLQAAYQALQQAQQALRRGDKHTARQLAEHAVQLAPELEEVWLLLAAVSSPRASVTYLERALQINPKSERARKGMHWAVKRLRAAGVKHPVQTPPQPAASKSPTVSLPAAAATKPLNISQRKISFPALLLTLACVALFALVASGSVTPALAFIRASVNPTEAHAPSSGVSDVDKPTYTPTPTDTPTPTSTYTPTPTFTPTDTPTPTFTPTETPTETLTPTDTPTDLPTETPWPTETPAPVKLVVAPVGNGVKWIDINLSQQMLYAYQGNTLANSFLISSGTWLHPTVTGQFSIWLKVPVQVMSGYGYYLPNVQWVMYFYKDYAIHGAYWHNNFGTPMSHGCINMRNDDAEWMYDWAPYGTLVNVHY